jgi:hypothetical protein
MHASLRDQPPELLAYYPMRDTFSTATQLEDLGIARWHLELRQGTTLSPSTAPAAQDAPFLSRPYNPASMHFSSLENYNPMQRIVQGLVGAAEYGDMENVGGLSLIGSYKRAYSTITEGIWCLTTGFSVGSVDLEWVGQVQTDPVVEGFIEGSPPIPAENYFDKALREVHPVSSIRFMNTSRTVYTYSSRNDGQ